MFETRWWRERSSEPGGTGGIDDALVGAEIMEAGKYGLPGWHDDPDWKGWWDPNPPFHTPVFVLTRHAPADRDGGRHDVSLHRCLARRRARNGP